MGKNLEVETAKLKLQDRFKNTVRSNYDHDKEIRTIGIICQICGTSVTMATRQNYIDEHDINGNQWAKVNAIRIFAESHMVPTGHSNASFKLDPKK